MFSSKELKKSYYGILLNAVICLAGLLHGHLLAPHGHGLGGKSEDGRESHLLSGKDVPVIEFTGYPAILKAGYRISG